MDPRRVVEENEIQDAEKPMAKHFENLFEKEEDKLMLVETIRNELRKTEKEEETPHQDKKSLKRKTKQKSSYSRKVKRTSARLEERIKKEQKEEPDIITIDAIRGRTNSFDDNIWDSVSNSPPFT